MFFCDGMFEGSGVLLSRQKVENYENQGIRRRFYGFRGFRAGHREEGVTPNHKTEVKNL